MADLHELVLAEEEAIRHALAQIPAAGRLRALSKLELAGTGAVLHSIYGGIENILKHVLLERGQDLPDGPSWHRTLLDRAVSCGVVQPETALALRPYMAFRHFFSHAYALDLDPERMESLVSQAEEMVNTVLKDVQAPRGDS